jgi:hypothetical protein
LDAWVLDRPPSSNIFQDPNLFFNFMGTNPTPVSMVFEGLGDFRP